MLDSQQAGFEAAKPGATYSDIHHACMRVIAERLHDWGLLPVSVEESLSPQGQQHRRWLACGVATTWVLMCMIARKPAMSPIRARRSRPA